MLAQMFARSIAIAVAVVIAANAFAAGRSQARGLGLGVGLGLGLIAASQAAKAAREPRKATTSRRYENERAAGRHHATAKVSRRKSGDGDAAERHAKVKTNRAIEARKSIARMQANLEKTKAAENVESTGTAAGADPAAPAELARPTVQGPDDAAKTATASAVEAEGDGGRAPEIAASPSIDCKRFIPAAGMTVSVACGN